ncbi:hypothetical protein [Streptomyces sp. NPDC126503]|uniref:hypothetical protein n=1 Tax=Streptomyces sp. NPDC126503 TaxID=3155315 RepID=UPI0033312BF7
MASSSIRSCVTLPSRRRPARAPAPGAARSAAVLVGVVGDGSAPAPAGVPSAPGAPAAGFAAAALVRPIAAATALSLRAAPGPGPLA